MSFALSFASRIIKCLIGILKKSGLISSDLIYRFCFMNIFGSKLYFKHKIESYRSCAFCKHLCYDRIIKKYVCSHRVYEASNSLVPCIVPDPTLMLGPSYIEEEEQIPWLFKTPCFNFEVLDSKNYYRNFVSANVNSSVIKLEALEGIMFGSCSGDIPCHICASVNKEAFTKCRYVSRSKELGKCVVIIDNLNGVYRPANSLYNAS